jgi:hypothetical protein
MQINQSWGIRLKMRGHKLRSDVNWYGALAQTGVIQGLIVLTNMLLQPVITRNNLSDVMMQVAT